MFRKMYNRGGDLDHRVVTVHPTPQHRVHPPQTREDFPQRETAWYMLVLSIGPLDFDTRTWFPLVDWRIFGYSKKTNLSLWPAVAAVKGPNSSS